MSNGLDYLFFTRKMADEFALILKERGISYSEHTEPVQEAIVLQIPEAIENAVWDELDELYDGLSRQDQALLESGMEDEGALSTAGIYLQLAQDRQTIAQVNPDVMNRMLSVVSLDEFNAFVEIIVQSVEKPDDTAICQRAGTHS